jgi:hypothetical protein
MLVETLFFDYEYIIIAVRNYTIIVKAVQWVVYFLFDLQHAGSNLTCCFFVFYLLINSKFEFLAKKRQRSESNPCPSCKGWLQLPFKPTKRLRFKLECLNIRPLKLFELYKFKFLTKNGTGKNRTRTLSL